MMIQQATERIQQMEQYFDALQKAQRDNPATLCKDAVLQKQLHSLTQYYECGQWLQDYELDEKGLLPHDLKRGVLAQDALYNFFEQLDCIDKETSGMNITQTFYDNLAPQYDKLFLDWQTATQEQAVVLDAIFSQNGFDKSARILDCACGIGTQAIGLAALGYHITASDISQAELAQARARALKNHVQIRFETADFRALSEVFDECFDIIIAMDNALPHMLTVGDLEASLRSITNRLSDGGVFVASIRDYDALLEIKPPYSPPYIHKTEKGQRVSFQTWTWNGDIYRLVQYIIDDEESLQVSKFECDYRATRRAEMTNLLLANGCSKVTWLFPKETGFYQPIVLARK